MFWLIIIAVSVIVSVLTLPVNKSSYPLLDNKPKKKETPMRKPPDVKYVGRYDCNKR